MASLIVADGGTQDATATYRALKVSPSVDERELYNSALQWAKDVPGDDEAPRTMVTFDVPEDSYGAAILAIAKESRHLIEPGEGRLMGILRLVYPLFLLSLNLLAQGLVLFFIFGQVVRPAVRVVQEMMVEFHKDIYTHDAQFRVDAWEAWDKKSEVCQLALSNRTFSGIILFLWTLSNTVEFRAAERFWRSIDELPYPLEGEPMIGEVDGSPSILSLNAASRRMLELFVVLPKAFFSCVLWYCGCEVLAATTSFQDLVLNTVAMNFVTNIDEILYHALLPASYAKLVSEINFTYYIPYDPRREERQEKQSFRRAFLWLVVTPVLVIVYMDYVQDVLPGELVHEIHHHCGAFLNDQSTICTVGQIISGEYSACFPYGPQ